MTTLEVPIAASSYDTLVYWNGSGWSQILMVQEASAGYLSAGNDKVGVGLVFQNITIPRSAWVNNAYLKLTAFNTNAQEAVQSKIVGQKTAIPSNFSTLADYQARRGTVVGGADNSLITLTVVEWLNIGAWVAGVEYNSPNIAAILNEIIHLPAWASGNSLGLFWDDHDGLSTPVSDTIRRAASFDHATLTAPVLHVEYEANHGAFLSFLQ